MTLLRVEQGRVLIPAGLPLLGQSSFPGNAICGCTEEGKISEGSIHVHAGNRRVDCQSGDRLTVAAQDWDGDANQS